MVSEHILCNASIIGIVKGVLFLVLIASDAPAITV